ncbi:MAG: HindIII family type II restriction endonuclease [Anaerolineae bacterium]|nr:HindIII family type II restriction endonuclease [Anaerolineae bacterium]
MDFRVINSRQLERRHYWVDEISRLSGDFGIDADRVEQELALEVKKEGADSLLGHLRLCGVIPERYDHDTSEEKLYSKYTDVVISEGFAWMGFTALVLKERADTADVECVSDDYSFVADAKAFRLSRTAKNQKDFKIQAMDNWKYGKPYAMVVCPVYQLPARISQIYQQAVVRSVCIATYTHLAVLVRYAQEAGQPKAVELLHNVFETVEAMHPTKDAVAYWQGVNRTFLAFDRAVADIWKEEKVAASESIVISRNEAMASLAAERERIMRLSREEAIMEVIRGRKLDNRIRAVQSVTDNGILEFI